MKLHFKFYPLSVYSPFTPTPNSVAQQVAVNISPEQAALADELLMIAAESDQPQWIDLGYKDGLKAELQLWPDGEVRLACSRFPYNSEPLSDRQLNRLFS